MTVRGVFGTSTHRSIVTALLLFATVIVTACGSTTAAQPAAAPAAAPQAAPAAKVAATVAPQAAAPARSAAGATPTTAGAPGSASSQCQAIGDAYLDLETSLPFVLALNSDQSYVANTPDSPTYIDIAKLRSDLDTLAKLPDKTSFGKTSDAISTFRSAVDLLDSNIKSGKPFSDGSGNGQKMFDLYAKLAQPLIVLGEGFGTLCSKYSPSTPVPDSNVAGYKMGQTAPVGDLRVTLDKVSTTVGTGINLAPAGQRFVLVYVTVNNTGKVAETLSVLTSSMKDAAGKQYFFDPFSGSPGGVDLTNPIPAGGKLSGNIGYVVPTNTSDLLWIVQDFGHNRAVFGINAADIVAEGPAVSPAGEAALRASAAATQTAFAELITTVVSADATQTATTPEPTGTPEAIDTPVPTDTPETIDTPVPTDTPEPDATPTAGG